MMLGTDSVMAAAETPGGNSALAGLLMATGVLIITVVMVLRLWKRRRMSAARSAVPIGERVGITAANPMTPRQGTDRMEAVMSEMQELTRLCAAQVENRVARLEMLLREADARIAQLEALTGAEAPAAPEFRVAPRVSAPSAPKIGSDELSQRVYELADSGLTPASVARELGEHTGKVELILALRQESRRSGAAASA